MRIVFSIIQIIAFVALLLYAGRTKISFSPFHFSIEKPFLIVAYIFVVIAAYCFYLDGYKDGYKKGCDDVLILIDKKKIITIITQKSYENKKNNITISPRFSGGI